MKAKCWLQNGKMPQKVGGKGEDGKGLECMYVPMHKFPHAHTHAHTHTPMHMRAHADAHAHAYVHAVTNTRDHEGIQHKHTPIQVYTHLGAN